MEITKTAPNSIGKVRVKFALEEDLLTCHGTHVLRLRKGVYDYSIPAPAKENWAGWFND